MSAAYSPGLLAGMIHMPMSCDPSTRGRDGRRRAVWLYYRIYDPDRRIYVTPCIHCGLLVGRRSMTVEHVIPLSRGGTHHLANLRPACGPCNQARGSSPLPLEDAVRAHLLRHGLIPPDP